MTTSPKALLRMTRATHAGVCVACVLVGVLMAGCGDDPASEPGSTPKAETSASGKLHEAMASEDFSLTEEKRKYVWNTEHMSLVLSQDLFPAIKQALGERKTEDLAAFLSPTFGGRALLGPGEAHQRGAVTLRIWDKATAASDELAGEAFLRALVAAGKAYTTVGKVSWHLTSLFPETMGTLDGPWRGAFDLHIQGALADGSRAETMLRCAIRFRALTEDLARRKGWIQAIDITRSWQVHTRAPLMDDISAASGIDESKLHDNWRSAEPPFYGVTGSLIGLDYDSDGRVDLLVTDQRGFFLYNAQDTGGFRDTTALAGLRFKDGEFVRSALVADVNGDGFEDIIFYVLSGEHGSVRPFENNGDGTFRPLQPGEHNLNSFELDACDGVVADFDGDGRTDLYLIRQGPRPPRSKAAPRWLGDRTSREGLLLLNGGGWRFLDWTREAGMSGVNVDTYGAVWLDLEPDGDADLFLSNHMGPNVLWVNQGKGTFKRRAINEGFGGFSMGVSAGDLDEDGDEDLYVANMFSSAGSRVMDNLAPADYPEGWFEYIRGFVLGNELYENRGKQEIVPVGVQAEVAIGGWSYGPALVDLDGDGRLDIYSPAGFQSVERGKPDG